MPFSNSPCSSISSQCIKFLFPQLQQIIWCLAWKITLKIIRWSKTLHICCWKIIHVMRNALLTVFEKKILSFCIKWLGYIQELHSKWTICLNSTWRDSDWRKNLSLCWFQMTKAPGNPKSRSASNVNSYLIHVLPLSLLWICFPWFRCTSWLSFPFPVPRQMEKGTEASLL